MPLAAKEEMLSASSDPCVFFPLAADPAELEARFGTAPQLSENSRQGFTRKNLALHQGSAWSNSGTALGIEPVLLVEGIRSRCKGKERDTETGNDDFGARYYTSRFGRWLSADWSNVPVAVPYANLTNPQTLNLYSMVSDDPESFADLDGHCGAAAMPGTLRAEPCSNASTQALQGEGAVPFDENTGIADWYSGEVSAATAEYAAQQAAQAAANQQAQNTANDNTKEGNTTVGALEKTMTNEVGSLSTPKKGNPDVLVDAKDALANTLINNANLDNPAKVAPATGTASTQDQQIMRDAATNRANGGADPVEGRTQFGTTHNPHIQSRSAMNHLKGAAGRETVYEKFGPFRDSVSRRPTWVVIYNNPGQ